MIASTTTARAKLMATVMATADAATQRVDEQMAAEPGPALVRDGAHRQGVVADDPLAAAQHIGGGRSRCGGDRSRGPQPPIELGDPGAEPPQPCRPPPAA